MIKNINKERKVEIPTTMQNSQSKDMSRILAIINNMEPKLKTTSKSNNHMTNSCIQLKIGRQTAQDNNNQEYATPKHT